MKSLIFILMLAMVSINVSAQKEGDWNTINPLNSPEARYGHSMVTLPDGRVMMFGGEGAQADLFNDLYVYDNNNWGEIIPENDPPSSRRDHTAWVTDNKMWIYGGLGQDGPVNDVWSYDISTNEWTEHILNGTTPTARYGHSLTPLDDGSKVILGGKDANGNSLNDCWLMNTDYSFVQLTDAPHSYSDHISVLTPNEMVVLGKTDMVALYSLLYNIWGEMSEGTPISNYASYCYLFNAVIDHAVISLFGGEGPSGPSDKVWEYNLNTGESIMRDTPLPGTVLNGAAVTIPDNSKSNSDTYRFFLFGGIINGEVSDACWVSNYPIPVSTNDDITKNENVINVIPNPVISRLYIEVGDGIQNADIYDIHGRLMKRINLDTQRTTVNMQDFNSGIYFVRIQLENGNQIFQKFVKK